jgi:hypothetical protein
LGDPSILQGTGGQANKRRDAALKKACDSCRIGGLRKSTRGANSGQQRPRAAGCHRHDSGATATAAVSRCRHDSRRQRAPTLDIAHVSAQWMGSPSILPPKKPMTRFRLIAVLEGFSSISLTVNTNRPGGQYWWPAISEHDECQSENRHRLNHEILGLQASATIIYSRTLAFHGDFGAESSIRHPRLCGTSAEFPGTLRDSSGTLGDFAWISVFG